MLGAQVNPDGNSVRLEWRLSAALTTMLKRIPIVVTGAQGQ